MKMNVVYHCFLPFDNYFRDMHVASTTFLDSLDLYICPYAYTSL